MDMKTIKTYEFPIEDFSHRLKPFQFYRRTIYYINNSSSKFNSEFHSLYKEREVDEWENEGYDLVYLSDNNRADYESLSDVYEYFHPDKKLDLSEQDGWEPEEVNSNPFLQEPKINYVQLLLQFLGVEEDAEDAFVYVNGDFLYVTLVQRNGGFETEEILLEIFRSIPSAYSNMKYYSPFQYYPEGDDDYNLILDEETRESVKEILDRLEHLNQSGQFLSILPILERQISQIREQTKVALSSLYIKADYRMFLSDYRNTEVKLSHLTKSLYFLFLKNDSIDLEEITELEGELLVIYKHISNQEKLDIMQERVSQLLKNENNELYVHFSRIKSAFCKIVDKSIASHYYIKGGKGQPKRIELNRELTNINRVNQVWFPN